ncbi:hypothetical protein K1W54_04405 [Micromonospora sp. CPCC 205371]|nr:hypothetical protein [Micromonospora sp. CPCC 205371]
MEIRAADLPDGSIVVDDLKGIIYYAGGDRPHRWFKTDNGENGDSTVDYVLQHGGTVVRVGDSVPVPTRVEWATEARYYDGTTKYTVAINERGAALAAESMAYHLSTLNEPTRRMGGIKAAALVRREVRELNGGWVLTSPWRHHCANCEGVDPAACPWNQEA